MSGYTAGPWRIRYDGDVFDEHKIIEWPYRVTGANGKDVADLVEAETSEADARLISAAPDMYEALTSMVKAATTLDSDAGMASLHLAVAAINKAEGRSQ